ncbi:MAG TPA: HAMP domain-containing sensor histidine kinase [Candidatus Nitrosotalea sp.]|nr:HAMP domain-containing sensor histidine kinase [Candidatus Nitrosotalea sp.]
MALVKTNNSERTEILFGQPAVLEKWKQCAFNTKNEINIYADSSGSLETLGFKNYLEILRSLKEKGVRIRYITEISKSNLQFCKMLMNVIPEFHHLDGIKGAFGVTDDEFLATATLQEVKPISHAIYSSAKQLVEVQRHIFETLWDRSVLAERKLKEIEEGTEPEFFEVINDPQRSTEIITNLAGMIHNEALVLLPLSKSMVRLYKLGILKHLANSSKRSKIRIICPIDSENEGIVQYLRSQSNISILDGPEGSIGLLIIDNSKFFISEVHEETGKEFSKTLGYGLYSNSIAVIQSIRLFFELLWKSDELNEKLKDHERLQAEFINIASHEIKTPIQALLTYSELLQSEPEKNESYVDAIQRNALRLKLLSNNLLDLTKIQNKTLVINKDGFDISEVISLMVEDFRNQIKSNQAYTSVELLFTKHDPIFVEADKDKIAQIVSNLIHNALKFTEKGTILVSLKKGQNEVTVSVKDTGAGIESHVIPNLFTKFTTRHHSGTGVGLYISKNIVEAHGGRIWGKNNSHGKGATFAFTLPAKS